MQVCGNSAFVDPVAGGLVCYGDGDMDRPIAVIQVNHAYAKAWAKENDNPDKENLDNFIKSKGFYDAVLANFKNEARNGGLSHLNVLLPLHSQNMGIGPQKINV